MTRTEKIILAIAGGFAFYYLIIRPGIINNMRYELASDADDDRTKRIFLKEMTNPEILAAYEFMKKYVKRGIPVEAGSALHKKIKIISEKYNIFT